jgi:hypothetical protein
MYRMRKNPIILLLLTIAFILPITAADPPSAAFNVSASISAINDMKITNSEVDEDTFGNSGNTFSGSVAIVGSGPGQNMDNDGYVDFTAYISALSNNRGGYTIQMSATPLSSTIGSYTATINYTVSVDGVSYNTKNSTNPVDVITVESLSELSVESLPISVMVHRSEFDSAVQGTYTGTVTFEYVSAT